MSINLRLEVKTLVSVLVNCPPKLQELEIWLSIFEDAEDKIEQMRMTRPTALRSLIFHDSLCGHEKAVLVPLLKQCPVLKNVKLPQINQAAYQEVLSSMIESCPILHSFENNNRHGFDIGRGLQLVEGFNGLRQVILNCTGILGGIPPVTPGATIKALLASSTGTLEVLKMYDRFSRWNPDITVNWIMGVVDVLEHCPNLKELEVPHGCVSLDDLVHKKDWDRPLWTDISTTNKEKMLLPWACKKLETLSLNIDNPSIKCFDPTTGSSLFDQQTSETEELGYKTVMQLGLLCQTLRSLKSLKSLDLAWDPFVLGAIGSMPFDRASFYYESYKGLQGITQQDIRWLGIEWCTIAERAQQEQLDRMCRVARKRSSHVCNTMEANSTTDPEDDEEEGHVELDADIDEMDMDIDLATHHDWIWYLNRKKVNKSKGVYARRSLRNGMSWFGKGAIDSSRY
ncbi:hypothetical protein BGZ46_008364 [Entomortierella lignicola]|nr:hypothetical protein BGZ46_008364 [Entomortierella lignicola]